MIGDLDMGSHFVKNVGINLSDDSTVVPRSYVDSFANSAIHNPLEIDLYASNFQIKQLKIPTDVQDAINKKYFDEELLKSHLLPSHIENAFKYLLDQDESSSERNIIVNGIQDYNGSPHKNKKAYDIDLIYTSGTQNYDSKIGINLYPLPVGKFTIIMEYYFPEDINISLLAEASTAIINKQAITNFPSYKKQLVQINQQTKDTPDYLFFTIRGSGTTATNPEGYLVFYGVKEWVDLVPPEIYDRALETGMFEYKNGDMQMLTDIDLNNNKIKNIPQPTNPTDLLIKQSVKIFDINLYGMIDQRNVLKSQGIMIRFDSIYIVKIVLYNSDKYTGGVHDRLTIPNRHGITINRFNYPFRFSPGGETIININRLFLGEIARMVTQTAIQIPFYIIYRALHI